MTARRLRPRGQCIFCSGTRMSKEHFWPMWASSMLPRWRENAYQELRVTSVKKSIVTHRKLRERQGDVSTKKLRVVCEACNNGWMNVVEGRARPILETLIAGNPCDLDQNQQLIVAEWIT